MLVIHSHRHTRYEHQNLWLMERCMAAIRSKSQQMLHVCRTFTLRICSIVKALWKLAIHRGPHRLVPKVILFFLVTYFHRQYTRTYCILLKWFPFVVDVPKCLLQRGTTIIFVLYRCLLLQDTLYCIVYYWIVCMPRNETKTE